MTGCESVKSSVKLGLGEGELLKEIKNWKALLHYFLTS